MFLSGTLRFMERMSAHQRRALTLIGLSLAVLAAAAAAYLGPAVFRPSTQPLASSPSFRWQLLSGLEGAVGSVRIGAAVVGMGRVEGGPVFLDPANVWWLMARPGPTPGPVALWRSGDGGRTWTQLAASGMPHDQLVGAPTFVDQLRGAMVVVPPSTLEAWPTLLTTQDGGETWQPATLPKPLVAGVYLAVPAPRSRCW